MAWGMLKLGEPYTCDGPCEHRDCAETRRMVAFVCRYCHEPIGEEREFCRDNDPSILVHFWCLDAALTPRESAELRESRYDAMASAYQEQQEREAAERVGAAEPVTTDLFD